MEKQKFVELNTEDLNTCSDAFKTFLNRPAHLPFAQSKAALYESSHLVG